MEFVNDGTNKNIIVLRHFVNIENKLKELRVKEKLYCDNSGQNFRNILM